jgi:hypothetical protein
MSTDVKISTELLYKGALMFALIDAVYIPVLVRRVNEQTFRRLKWSLAIVSALVWFGIWSWAIGNYWETVYSYVFPAWAQMWVPWIALIAAEIVALALWALALRLKGNMVLAYCLFGGLIGSLTHIWAVRLGIVSKPPMLQGASSLAAVVIAFFEFMFYWCTILMMAAIIDWLQRMWRRKQATLSMERPS